MPLADLGPYPNEPGYEEAVALDAGDELAAHGGRYVRPDPDLIYLDGNSLGRLHRKAVDIIDAVTNEGWGDRLIRSWNDGWWDMQLRLGDKLAPLIGAEPGEVIISDSTTVNLYKLAEAALMACDGERRRIVTDDLNFPTDVYILDGVARRHGGELAIVASDGIHGPLPALADAIDQETALVSLSHTAYTSGYTYDMAAISEMAHEAGAMVLWDCSHSVGALQVDVETSGADLAVGCTYKYLNGGPGSPAFLYVRREHQDRLSNPIPGWWGHEDPFGLALDFTPVSGIRRFHTGTMPILSLAAIEAGIDDVIDAGIPAIRAKSLALSRFLVDMAADRLAPLGFTLASPSDPASRGSHVTLAHEMGWPITRAMIDEAAVIPDFRAPHNIRLGLAPLYTSFVDIHTAIVRFERVVDSGTHLAYEDVKATVT